MAELHIVIKHTKTIEEYKQKHANMKDKANRYFYEHFHAFENHDEWRDGEPVRAWYDTDGNFCLEYESGEWWHYRETASGLEWW